MSVIVGRALPDVRDGLKPVHRRVLYAMKEGGNDWNRAYRKSARTVGDVMGKYHPHGDSAIYDTLVRMAQPFSMRHVLVDGQGNFGSIDGDSPAAMRYTEARLSRLAYEMMADLDQDTVDWGPNYDDSLEEPLALPTRFPNLLVNGSQGIAVGMATSIPPHNLRECCGALMALIDDPTLGLDGIMEHIKGPDFPGGGLMLGTEGVLDAYRTGRGRCIVRAKTHVEQIKRAGDRGADRLHRAALPGEQGHPRWRRSPSWCTRRRSTASAISATRATGKASAWWWSSRRARPATSSSTSSTSRPRLQNSFPITMLCIVNGQPRILHPAGDPQGVHRLPPRGGHPAHPLPAAQGRGAAPHPHGPQDRPGLPGRGHQAHPRRPVPRGGQAGPHGGRLRHRRRRSRRTPPSRSPTSRPRPSWTCASSASPAWSGRRSSRSWRKLEKTIADLKAILADDALLMKVIRDEFQAVSDQFGDDRRTEICRLLRQHPHGGRGARRGDGRHHVQGRLHQAHRPGRLPPPEAGRQGQAGHEDQGRGFRRAALPHQGPRHPPGVHGPRLRLRPEGLRPARERPPPPGASTSRTSSPSRTRRRSSPSWPSGSSPRTTTWSSPPADGTVKKTSLSSYANIRANGLIALNIDEGNSLVSVRVSTRRPADPPDQRPGQGHPLPRRGCPRHGPHRHRRARHAPGQRGPHRGHGSGRRPCPICPKAWMPDESTAEPRHAPHGHREGLRQAQPAPGLPAPGPGRHGRHQHPGRGAQRPGGGFRAGQARRGLPAHLPGGHGHPLRHRRSPQDRPRRHGGAAS